MVSGQALWDELKTQLDAEAPTTHTELALASHHMHTCLRRSTCSRVHWQNCTQTPTDAHFGVDVRHASQPGQGARVCRHVTGTGQGMLKSTATSPADARMEIRPQKQGTMLRLHISI